MSLVFGFALLIALIYSFWAFSVLRGWKRYAETNREKATNRAISVVIPIRNEEENLVALLASISKLNYNKDLIELVLVDDGSTDSSWAIAEKWCATAPFKVQLISATSCGKKAAQHQGIEAASNAIIACTDADCQLPVNWLTAINETMLQHNANLVFGGVLFVGTAFPYQRIEFLSLIGSTMAMLANGWAVMGNAANMAFYKTDYQSVFTDLNSRNTPSGDDVFLLHALAKAGKVIAPIAGADAAVQTEPQPTIKALLSQRVRWASKAKRYVNSHAIGVGALVFLVNVVLLCLFVSSLFTPAAHASFAVLLFAKIGVDYMLLTRFASYYNQPFEAWHFVVQEFINMCYIPGVALISLGAKFTWKGRKY